MATLTLVGASDEPDYSGHAMVALYPQLSEVKPYVITGGLEPEKMHVTMAYLGLAADVDKAAVEKALGSLPSRQPFAARISGHARFTGGEEDVLVALVDSPEIERLRIDLLAALRKQGISIPRDHGFTPHMTLAYMDPQALTPLVRLEPANLNFDAVWLKHAKAKQSYPFGDPIPESIRTYARTAYAQGWAASGGPMTAAVMAGSIAAMDLCEEHAHDPHILEVAIHLGRLEGVWAKVFERRFKMMANFTAMVTALWRRLMKILDVPGNIAILRQQAGIAEDSNDDAQRRQALRKIARDVALRMLGWLPGTSEWQSLRDAMRQLVASGQAEGYADAIDIAASEQDIIGYSFDIAFQHAYDALANLGQAWADSDTWLQQMLGRAADQFGRVLGDLAAADASYEDMVNAAMDVLDMTYDGVDAVEFTVDWALSAGFSRGALDLYRSENVEYVTWMTAGDDRVCPVCEKNGADSPFLISDFPDMPAHPRCRCVATAEFVLGSDFGGFFS